MKTTGKERFERRDIIEAARRNTQDLREIIDTVREQEDSPDSVDLIASGYEWTCPKCDTLNHEIETHDTVSCANCGASWIVSTDLHAEG